MREARLRRDLIAGELAAGRNPRDLLRAAAERPTVRTLADWWPMWLASRIDVDDRTRANYGFHWRRIEPTFGDRDPATIDHGDVQAWVNEQTETLTPAVVRDYVGTLRQLLDFVGLESNPARHRSVKLPRAERTAPVPPTDRHVLAMLDAIRRERRLLFAYIEQTGVRLGEALAWEWPDIDLDSLRILSRAETVKGRRGSRQSRWVQIPPWLLELLLDRVPPDDRSGYIFGWPHQVSHPRQRVEKVMATACKVAGIPHFHPHDLRHRRISLWHGQGIPWREIGDRVGQRDIAITANVYSHVMPIEELDLDAYRAALVWSRCGLGAPEKDKIPA